MNDTIEFREVTAQELETVAGGGLISDAIRKVGDFLRGPELHAGLTDKPPNIA